MKFISLSILLFVAGSSPLQASIVTNTDTLSNSIQQDTTLFSEVNHPKHQPDTIVIDDDDDVDTADVDSAFTDDFDTYPASEYYHDSWSTESLNPYKVKVGNLPDSVEINCSDFCYPTKSNHITSPFGPRHGRFHYGTDIGLSVGDTVYAVFPGKVRFVTYERRGYGHYVVIRHDNGLESLSAHLSKVLVKENEDVKAGEPIGLGGSTGRSTGPHLHFELRFLGDPFNTAKLIDYKTKSLKHGDEYLLTRRGTYAHEKELKQLAQAQFCYITQGDTLSRIASRHGTTVKRLCQLNHIRPSALLRVGRRLRYR